MRMNLNFTKHLITSKVPGVNFRISVILLVAALMTASCVTGETENTKLPFVVSINPESGINHDQIILPWEDVVARTGQLDISKVRIKDLNNGQLLIPVFYDSNKDQNPDYLVFKTRFLAQEPMRPFEIITIDKNKDSVEVNNNQIEKDVSLQITYLTSSSDYLLENNLNGKWAETIAKSILETYPNPAKLEIFAPGEWSYTNGFFTNGLSCLYSYTEDEQYINYVQNWLDLFLLDDGHIKPENYTQEKYRLDDILPGRSLLYIYDKTGDPKYLTAANTLIDHLDHQPRTSEGGYWHKNKYDWQMWLDGVYMSDVFMLQYANDLNKPQYYNEAIHQMKLIYKHTHDSVSGLLYHGWDESKSKVWADKETGVSPEFWGRGIGWYMMALVDALDYIPETHPERKDVIDILVNVASALKKYQDKQSGLWYQVVDKASMKGNWPEASCSAMFAYSFLKGYKKGYLSEEYEASALKAYQGLKDHFINFDDSGKLYLTGTVMVGTLNEEYSNGSYEYYISVDRRVNDFKGLAALLYLAIADEYMSKNES
jgi:unsaturated rhamnogalacturonyl hydrolase